MNYIYNKLRYLLFVMLVLVLLIPAAPISGTVSGAAGRYTVYEQAPPPAEKIDPAVGEALAGKDYVEVLVKLTRQVDTGLVARDALRHAPSGEGGRAAVRAAVVDELRANADACQKSLMLYLEQERHKGNVLEYRGYYVVNMVFVKAAPAVVKQLARRADVKLILPNSVIQMELPEIVESGEIISQAVEWGVSRINAPAAWSQGYMGQGVVVGVIDTGVDWQHEALQTKWRGCNPSNPGSPNVDYNWFDATTPKSPLPKDANGHGTHVTGTILGSAGANQIGAAPGAQWIAARAFGDDDRAYSSTLLSAGQFMLAPTDRNGQNPRPDLAPHIVNNSWGSEIPGEADEWFRPMVQAWRDAQILPVFAAGNDGEHGPGSISNPANYPESLAVAATDSGDKLASFSSRGPGYMEGIKPEISAPGVGIRSSYNNGGYATAQGTSMAAPHVSGAAALLLSANANLDVDELQQVLIDTAIPLTDPAYPEWPNYGYGYGLVDALAAINSLSTIYGDLDGSGSVNVVDAVMVLRHAASLLSLTPEQAAAADANGDGYVNIADAIIVLRYIAGLVGELPYRP